MLGTMYAVAILRTYHRTRENTLEALRIQRLQKCTLRFTVRLVTSGGIRGNVPQFDDERWR